MVCGQYCRKLCARLSLGLNRGILKECCGSPFGRAAVITKPTRGPTNPIVEIYESWGTQLAFRGINKCSGCSKLLKGG